MQRTCYEKEAIRFEPSDLGQLIADAVQMALSMPELAGCSVQLTGEGCASTQWVVPDTITNMLINLLINAAEAKPGGAIEVRLACDQQHVEIEVHDQGPGVAPQHVVRIFRPRYSTKRYHMGLGLLAVKAAVEIHSGSISVGKSHLGGACFRVRFAAK